MGPGVCISNKLPGDADAAGPRPGAPRLVASLPLSLTVLDLMVSSECGTEPRDQNEMEIVKMYCTFMLSQALC